MKGAGRAVLCVALVAAGTAPAGQPANQGRAAIGTFTATAPCPDCSRHRLELTLYPKSAADDAEGTFELRETFTFVMLASGERGPDRIVDSRGRWIAVKVTEPAPAIVYRLNPDKPEETWNLLRASVDELREIAGARRVTPQATLVFRRVATETAGQAAGYRAAAVDAPDVKNAAEFAARAHALRTGDAIRLTRVLRAQQQLVRGLNFRLCLEVEIQGNLTKATAVVYRDLNGYLALSQWFIGECS